ncbi:MAG: phage tail assembly protein [Deltaproteobacteria bacterium]|nr:phage tail assembly protein [Deltaproteobacteria bacterium]
MIYTLRRPIMGTTKDGDEVSLVTELDLRLPNAGDVKAVEKFTGAAALLATLHRLSGVSRELLERLSVEDFNVLDDIITGFFSSAGSAQAANAWLKSQGLPGLPDLQPTSGATGASSS